MAKLQSSYVCLFCSVGALGGFFLWFCHEPSFEPAIGFILCCGGIAGSEIVSEKTNFNLSFFSTWNFPRFDSRDYDELRDNIAICIQGNYETNPCFSLRPSYYPLSDDVQRFVDRNGKDKIDNLFRHILWHKSDNKRYRFLYQIPRGNVRGELLKISNSEIDRIWSAVEKFDEINYGIQRK